MSGCNAHRQGQRDLPDLIAEVVEPLREQRLEQAQTFDMYRATVPAPKHVDHAIVPLYRRGVINVQHIEQVLAAYEKPPHDWGSETAYRFFHAVTSSSSII